MTPLIVERIFGFSKVIFVYRRSFEKEPACCAGLTIDAMAPTWYSIRTMSGVSRPASLAGIGYVVINNVTGVGVADDVLLHALGAGVSRGGVYDLWLLITGEGHYYVGNN